LRGHNLVELPLVVLVVVPIPPGGSFHERTYGILQGFLVARTLY